MSSCSRQAGSGCERREKGTEAAVLVGGEAGGVSGGRCGGKPGDNAGRYLFGTGMWSMVELTRPSSGGGVWEARMRLGLATAAAIVMSRQSLEDAELE